LIHYCCSRETKELTDASLGEDTAMARSGQRRSTTKKEEWKRNFGEERWGIFGWDWI
jgi:hypothetical protein